MDRTRIRGRRWLLLALALGTGCAALSGASAQSAPADAPVAAPSAPPPRALPRPDQLEPGVDTTAPASGTAGGAGKPAAAPTAAPPAAATPGGAAARAAPAGPAAKVPAARPGKAKGADRLELDTTDITGNRELPKVLYIVPWKRSDLGDLVGKPVNSLLDEMLQPLDRDVFQRENRYYDAVKPAQARPDAGAAPPAGDKP